MKLKLSCADFSFPLLPYDAALKLVSLLGLGGVDIGLFAGRSHLRPEMELRQAAKNGERLRSRLANHGLEAADVFLQVHENFTDFAINHPEPSRREFARSQFSRTLEYAASAGSKHITILPGVAFKNEPRAASENRAVNELSWRVEGAAAMKLAIAIEPHVGSIADTPERALSLATRVPGLGLTLDYAHFTRAGVPDVRIQPLSSRTTHFHARCARRNRLQSCFKDNTINFENALRALHRQRFAGWIALEYVWIDWEHCNEVDVISETILLGNHLKGIAKKSSRRNV